MPSRPSVLVFSGLDPSGGAGIQADIEAISAQACHSLPVVTTLTVQDSCQLYQAQPVSTALIEAQVNVLMEDFGIAVIKAGATGCPATTRLISHIAGALAPAPLVLDPVIRAGGGGQLGGPEMLQALQALLPTCFLATPNTEELAWLGGPGGEAEQANRLLNSGCKNVLVTGGHRTGATIKHVLYRLDHPPWQFTCHRLAGSFHGSGCTLTAAIAGRLAQGDSLQSAIMTAQTFTFDSLKTADQPGRGQKIPRRTRTRIVHP